METYFNEPMFQDDGDFQPLTPEERKAIYKAAGVMLVILAVAGIFIYIMYHQNSLPC
jgi:hypothetical protein